MRPLSITLAIVFFWGINPSFWSIAVEVQLYALYPLLVALVARFGWRRSLLAIAILEITLRLLDGVLFTMRGAGLPRWIGGSPFIYWFSWSIGAFVADRHVRGNNFKVPGIALAGIVSMAVACSFFKPLSSMAFLFFALLTAGAVAKILYNADQGT